MSDLTPDLLAAASDAARSADLYNALTTSHLIKAMTVPGDDGFYRRLAERAALRAWADDLEARQLRREFWRLPHRCIGDCPCTRLNR